MMRILFYLLWLMLLAVLQPTLGSGIAVFSIAPNLFYAFIVLIGLYRGKTEGAVCGIVPFWTAMLRIAVPEGVYSGLIGWLLSFPMVASMKLFKMKQIS